MGQRDAFSSQDITKLNKMYKCPTESYVDGSVSKPPLNAHNNINELIDEDESSTAAAAAAGATTKKPTPSTSRPNRPFLNLVGNLIGAALNQGK